MLRKRIRLILFLSSYAPMFFIFALRNPFQNWIAQLSFFVLGIISILVLILILKTCQSLAPEIVEVAEIEFKGSESMSYVVTYIIPFLGVDFSSAENYLSLLIMFFTLAILYMNSNLIYTNPLINILGYQIYRIQDIDGRNIMLLTKEPSIKAKAKLSVIQIDGNIYVWEGNNGAKN